MADEDLSNLTDEEREELANPVIEEEDSDVDIDPADLLDPPTDLQDAGIEDDSGFLETVFDDGDPALADDADSPVGTGVVR